MSCSHCNARKHVRGYVNQWRETQNLSFVFDTDCILHVFDTQTSLRCSMLRKFPKAQDERGTHWKEPPPEELYLDVQNLWRHSVCPGPGTIFSPSEWRLWEGWTKWPPVGRVSRWRTALPWPHWGPGFVSQRMRLLAPVRASVSCSRHENTILKHWSTRDMWEWVGAKWWMLVASHRPSPSVVPEELPLAPSLIKWMQSLCRKADLYVPWDTKRSQQLHLSLLSLWANTSVSMGERHMQASSAAGMETFNCCCLRCLHIGP